MSGLATPQASGAVPPYAGMAELADRYDGFIVDLWGVLHDGVRAFPKALHCLSRLRARDKRVLILTNAPRRAAAVAARCEELGLTPEHYDVVMSSGEDAWRHLKDRPDPWYQALGRRCYHLGPARDLGMREGLRYSFVDRLEDADFILNTGALSKNDSAETYASFLGAALQRRLPMICANPDLVVIRGGRREICAGSIAARYDGMGGEVRYHGKPHQAIYRACLDLFGEIPPERILAVGDSVRTDVAGAQRAGMDALFVVSGIHREELGYDGGGLVDPKRLLALCEAEGARPLGVLAEFRW